VVADAGLDGTARGFVDYPTVELPPTEQGKFDVGAAVGHLGYVFVLRDEGQEQPYTSTVELVSGEIGEDLANYLLNSEQTPSALVLGEAIDTHGVAASGGLLIQVLPKAATDEALVAELESRMAALSGFTPLLQAQKTLPEILEQVLGGMDLHIFPESQPLRFHCRCSYDRALGALKLFSIPELEDMIEKDHGAEAVCEFCGNVYRAGVDELNQLIGELQGSARE
jgi:molecular chaperone Hsp33